MLWQNEYILMNKKRQKILINPSSVDELLARSETAKISAKGFSLFNEKTKNISSEPPAGILNTVEISLSDTKTSTSYNISNSLLLAVDQACLELKAAGFRRISSGRKVTRGHLVEVALFYALQNLRRGGLQSEVATLLLEL